MVTRCCCCGVGGKKSRRKSVPEDRKRLITSNGGGKKRRPVSGDSAVSNSTFASAVGSPHNYEDECDARLEGQRQEDEDHRVWTAARARAKPSRPKGKGPSFFCAIGF